MTKLDSPELEKTIKQLCELLMFADDPEPALMRVLSAVCWRTRQERAALDCYKRRLGDTEKKSRYKLSGIRVRRG